MSEASLLFKFPELTRTHFRITSPVSHRYTCVAWAAGDDRRIWLPDEDGIFYWPEEVPREYTLPAWTAVFETLGYGPCENPDLEEGVEKVAIYVNPAGEPKHVARQLPSGWWTSKVGTIEDIEHELAGLVGERYGRVTVILSRPCPLPGAAPADAESGTEI